jgi:transcriptional regulator with XRE-family HTH domain
MDEITTIERQLREAIAASGQSYRQLAAASAVDNGRLSRFMRGERGLTVEAVGRLCQALGLQLAPISHAEQVKPAANEPAKKAKRVKK